MYHKSLTQPLGNCSHPTHYDKGHFQVPCNQTDTKVLKFKRVPTESCTGIAHVRRTRARPAVLSAFQNLGTVSTSDAECTTRVRQISSVPKWRQKFQNKINSCKLPLWRRTNAKQERELALSKVRTLEVAAAPSSLHPWIWSDSSVWCQKQALSFRWGVFFFFGQTNGTESDPLLWDKLLADTKTHCKIKWNT